MVRLYEDLLIATVNRAAGDLSRNSCAINRRRRIWRNVNYPKNTNRVNQLETIYLKSLGRPAGSGAAQRIPDDVDSFFLGSPCRAAPSPPRPINDLMTVTFKSVGLGLHPMLSSPATPVQNDKLVRKVRRVDDQSYQNSKY